MPRLAVTNSPIPPDRLRTLRVRAGLTQEEVGQRINRDGRWYGGVERSEHLPGLATLALIAQALGVTLAELIPNPAVD